MTRRIVVSAWLGFALTALFFYPLALAFDADSYYLLWRSRDLAEVAVALAVLTLLLSAVLFALWPRSGRAATLALMAIAMLPLASFAAGALRQLPFDDGAMVAAWENGVLRRALPAALVGLLTFGLVFRPRAFERWFRRLLILVSPISLVVMVSFIASAPQTDPIVSVERAPGAAAGTVEAACAPVLALLFDELSFSYLYDEAGSVHPDFPELRRVVSNATEYLSVTAPGRETLNSLPSFLAARHLRDIEVHEEGLRELAADGRLVPFNATTPDGLFATARGLGFTTEMAGFYLPYCDLLGGLVDACHSRSFYNLSSADEDFSLVDPVLTTLVLWPRQFPFGLLKNPPFAVLQRELVEDAAAFARRPMQATRPVFRLVHFSVPHLPFVFDADGYNPPFDPLRTAPDERYVRQLQYVDRLVGELVAHMREAGTYDGTTVVILSDHGYRFGGRERDPLHIPFIVKGAGQRTSATVTASIPGESLLKQVVQDACVRGDSAA